MANSLWVITDYQLYISAGTDHRGIPELILPTHTNVTHFGRAMARDGPQVYPACNLIQ